MIDSWNSTNTKIGYSHCPVSAVCICVMPHLQSYENHSSFHPPLPGMSVTINLAPPSLLRCQRNTEYEAQGTLHATQHVSTYLHITYQYLHIYLSAVYVSALQGGMRRCEMSYRRCESSVAEMIKMIDIEVRLCCYTRQPQPFMTYSRCRSLTQSTAS